VSLRKVEEAWKRWQKVAKGGKRQRGDGPIEDELMLNGDNEH
jgi:hypothetical protein